MSAAVAVHNDQYSLVGFTPFTDEARQWFKENVETENWQWMGSTLWVDVRFAVDLANGLAEAGLLE